MSIKYILQISSQDISRFFQKSFSSSLASSGMKAKFSVKILKSGDVIPDIRGSYLAKPSTSTFPFLAENEYCSMRIQKIFGLKIPEIKFAKTLDGKGVFLIRKFAASVQGNVILQIPKSRKVDLSYEEFALEISKVCGEKKLQQEIFKRVLGSFLVGNGDLHLGNFSFYLENNKLTPIYDVVNTAIYIPGDDLCMPLCKDHFPSHKNDRQEFILFGKKLGLSLSQMETLFKKFAHHMAEVHNEVDHSALPKADRDKYHQVLKERASRMGFTVEKK